MDYINKIICGSNLEVLPKLPDKSVNCVVTSPPYWDEQIPFEEYVTNLCDIFDQVKRILKNDGTCWVVIGALDNNLMIPERFALEMINRGWIKEKTRIWYKPETLDFDYIYLFTKENRPNEQPAIIKEKSDDHIFRLEQLAKKLKKYKEKHHIDIWWLEEEICKLFIDSVGGTIWEPKGEHYPSFPEALIEPMIQAGCPKGGIVLDPFGGVGTTGKVAKKQGKKYVIIEIKKEYVDMANRGISAIPELLFKE